MGRIRIAASSTSELFSKLFLYQLVTYGTGLTSTIDREKNNNKSLIPKPTPEGILTRAEFQSLSTVPAEVEWFASIDNKRTRRAYQIDFREFMQFVRIERPEKFRIVTRAHVGGGKFNFRTEVEGADLTDPEAAV